MTPKMKPKLMGMNQHERHRRIGAAIGRSQVCHVRKSEFPPSADAGRGFLPTGNASGLPLGRRDLKAWQKHPR